MKRVTHACFHCKKAHAACDTSRPCSRCVSQGKAAECRDPEPKKRGRKPKPKIGKSGYERQKGQKLSPPSGNGNIGVQLHKWTTDNRLAAGTIGADLRQWAQSRNLQQSAPKLGPPPTLPPLSSHPFPPAHRPSEATHRTPPTLPQHITSETFDPPKIPFDLGKSKSMFGEGGSRGLGFDPPGGKSLFGDPSKPKHMGGPFDRETSSFDMDVKNGAPDSMSFGEGRSAFDVKSGGYSLHNKKGEYSDTSMRERERDRDREREREREREAPDRYLGNPLHPSAFRPSSDFIHTLLADMDMMKQFYQNIKHEQHNLQSQMNRWHENISNIPGPRHTSHSNSPYSSSFTDQGRDKPMDSTSSPSVPFVVQDASKPFAFLQKRGEEPFFIFANETFCSLYGYNLNELLGKNWSTVLPNEERIGFSPLNKNPPSPSSKISPILCLQESHKTKGGTIFKAVTRHQTFYDLDGKPTLDVVYIDEYSQPSPSHQSLASNQHTSETSTTTNTLSNLIHSSSSSPSSSVPPFSTLTKQPSLPPPHSIASHSLSSHALPLQQATSHTL